MAARFFSPFTRHRRGNARGDHERLVENDVMELSDVVSEKDGNGFTQRDQPSDTKHAITCTVYSSENNCTVGQLGLASTNDNATATTVADSSYNPASKTKLFALLGIVLSIIGSFMLSFSSLMVKLAESIPSLEIVFMRLTLQLVFSLPPMIYLKDQFIYPWKKTRLLILRAVTGVTAMSLMVYSVKHMPLADARVIFYTSPVYTALLGRIFLKESITKFDLIAAVLCLGGVVLIGRPTFLFGSLGKSSNSEKVWLPTIIAIVSAILMACAVVVVRKISQEVGARVVVFYFSLIGSVISLSASLISGEFKYPDCGTHDTVYVIAIGVIGYSAQLIVTKALALEKASVVSLVRTIGIAFSFILQLIFLDVVPNGFSIGGAILVLLCNVVIFIKKFLDQKKVINLPTPLQ